MAEAQQLKTLRETLSRAQAILAKDLIARSDWGSLKFERAAPDFQRARDLVSYLAVLPIEHLPDSVVAQLQSATQQLVPTLAAIDGFVIADNAMSQREALTNSLHAQTDQFYGVAGQWIPYLAYQRGDVAKNIEQLARSVAESRGLIEKAKGEIQERSQEIDRIIVATREASAAAGAAVFTKDFQDESSSTEAAARHWLYAAATGVVFTLVAAVVFLVLARQPVSGPVPVPVGDSTAAALSGAQVAQVIGAKLIILTLLVSASTWCGRNYRALKHLSVLNRHRALSLRTLQAFSAAASDEGTKNAVLLEATRAIFNAGVTGYIESKDSGDESLKVVEIARGLGSRSPA